MKDFDKLFLDEFDRMSSKKKIRNIWEVVLSVLSKYSEPYLITLKADKEIFSLITEGFSAHAISNRLGVSSEDVFNVANAWGFTVLDTSLEVNPFVVYRSGMNANSFQLIYNTIVPVEISLNIAVSVINNIEQYYNIIKFLEEHDK